MKTKISKIWPVLALMLALSGTRLEAKETNELNALRFELPTEPGITFSIKNMPDWEGQEEKQEKELTRKMAKVTQEYPNVRIIDFAEAQMQESQEKENKKTKIVTESQPESQAKKTGENQKNTGDILEKLKESKLGKKIKSKIEDVTEELAERDLSLEHGGLAYEIEGGDESTHLNISPKKEGSVSLEYSKQENKEDVSKKVKLEHSGREGISIYGSFTKRF